jgi:hypothetical protein
MADGNLDRVTFKTFAYNTLYKAMERNKEQRYRLLCPTSKLKRLLACETCDEEALRVRIAESYQTYAKSNPLETIPTQDEAADLNNDDRDADEVGYDSDDFRSGDSSTSRRRCETGGVAEKF